MKVELLFQLLVERREEACRGNTIAETLELVFLIKPSEAFFEFYRSRVIVTRPEPRGVCRWVESLGWPRMKSYFGDDAWEINIGLPPSQHEILELANGPLAPFIDRESLLECLQYAEKNPHDPGPFHCYPWKIT